MPDGTQTTALLEQLEENLVKLTLNIEPGRFEEAREIRWTVRASPLSGGDVGCVLGMAADSWQPARLSLVRDGVPGWGYPPDVAWGARQGRTPRI